MSFESVDEFLKSISKGWSIHFTISLSVSSWGIAAFSGIFSFSGIGALSGIDFFARIVDFSGMAAVSGISDSTSGIISSSNFSCF